MKSVGLMLFVAGTQFRNLLLRLYDQTLGGLIPYRLFVVLMASVPLAILMWLSAEAHSVGSELSSTFGPGLAAGLFFFGAMSLGATAIIGQRIWSGNIQAERERLAVLPLQHHSLSLLSALPTLTPVLLGLGVSLPPLVLLSGPTGIGLGTGIGAAALGLSVPIALAAAWSGIALLVRRPRADQAMGLVLVGALMLLWAHALWLAGRESTDITLGGGFSPVVWVLRTEGNYTASQILLCLGGLAASTFVLVAVKSLRRRLPPRQQEGSLQVALFRDGVPLSSRVWEGLVRVALRQSALASEIGIAALLCASVSFLSSYLWVQGRHSDASTAMLVAAGFAALPLLGLRNAVGPTYRLVQLGVRTVDARVGVVMAAAFFFVAALLPGLALHLWRGVGPFGVLRFILISVVSFSVGLVVASLLRRITESSLGRTLAAFVLAGPLVAMVATDLQNASTSVLVGVAISSVLVATMVLAATLRRRTMA